MKTILKFSMSFVLCLLCNSYIDVNAMMTNDDDDDNNTPIENPNHRGVFHARLDTFQNTTTDQTFEDIKLSRAHKRCRDKQYTQKRNSERIEKEDRLSGND